MEILELVLGIAFLAAFFILGYKLGEKYNKNAIIWGLVGAIFPLGLLYFAFVGEPKNVDNEKNNDEDKGNV
jgi:predicted tellurium resistance membrane protein TerC